MKAILEMKEGGAVWLGVSVIRTRYSNSLVEQLQGKSIARILIELTWSIAIFRFESLNFRPV